MSEAISPPEGFKLFDKNASTFYVSKNYNCVDTARVAKLFFTQ